jgi:hypothetical protein
MIDTHNYWRSVMKLLKALAALLVAGSAFAAASGAAWAAPCASGERIVGKTSTAWLCMNVDTGAVRPVEF